MTASPPPSRTVWRIGSEDGPSPDLPDNYKRPLDGRGVTWRVARDGNVWPIFQASEADPEGGYRAQTRRVEFDLDRVTSDFELVLDVLVIAPRVPTLHLTVNGMAGAVHLSPKASESGEIRLLSGLHTSIYADERLTVALPRQLFRTGANVLEITAVDGGDVLRIDSPDKIARLDRMANGAGVIWQHLALREADDPTTVLTIEPSVLHREVDGVLTGRVDVILRHPTADRLKLRLDDLDVDLPVAPTVFGDVTFTLQVPRVEADLRVEASHGARTWTFTVPRKRLWTVYVAAHSHTDIGYTHRQEEVAERHSRNLDAAVAFLDAGDANFAYHLDASWPLLDYLRTRSPGQVERLRHWVREGRVNVAANFADLLTNLASLEELVENARFTNDFLSPLGLGAKLAAVVDVASISASVPDVLAGSGVKYLVHANNQDRGPFRLNGNLHRASPFVWEGVAGGRVLVWLAKMYCELRKVCGSPPVLSSAERGLGVWLSEFERPDYLLDAVLLYGQEADNTDLDPQPNAFIGAWNAEYAYPRLVPSDPTAFFEHAERAADRLPVFKGDGGAYWEDGALTSLRETILARKAQSRLPAADTLAALASVHDDRLRFAPDLHDDAWRDLLLYDEHTWGAFLSVTDPGAALDRDQWSTKAGFAENAARRAREALHAAASRHSLQFATNGREVVAYNPHNWTVTDVVTVEIAHGEAPVDERGEAVPYRELKRHPTQREIQFVATVEGLAYRRWPLTSSGGVRAPRERPKRWNAVFAQGRLTSLVDLETGLELAGPQGLGAFVSVFGGEGSRILSNQADLPLADLREDDAFDLLELRESSDDLGDLIVARGRTPLGELSLRVSLPSHEKRVDFEYVLDKLPTAGREAAYVRFDTTLDGARVRSDSQLGWIDWNRDRLPGACLEWLPLQSAVLLDTPNAALCLASPDVPLFTVGDAVRGAWPKEKDLSGGRVFGYVLSNYWHTNYRAGQEGRLRFRYSLVSDASLSTVRAGRFGREARLGLYAHRVSFQDFRAPFAPYGDSAGGRLAFVSGDVDLSLMRASRDGRGVIVRVTEPSGTDREAVVRFPGRFIARATLTDLLERDLRDLPFTPDELRFPVSAWGAATVRVEFALREDHP
ncbi:glycosyl hydrolase-related protein [Deinococcus yavapaiensis]|uniref:Glycosyl hydrolase family 38 n=1 Tax=Deinococcus yavapaiensis KR-236 TaxID=694435 RepID=A0A318SCR5_9DEIO|nr:glycosyl hydrolase-related protein [Deinococcus yavapaiensis]PYE54598.1 glycosyl hydrolase family 38 [Deinococcus yavapaiensis KR-236]